MACAMGWILSPLRGRNSAPNPFSLITDALYWIHPAKRAGHFTFIIAKGWQA